MQNILIQTDLENIKFNLLQVEMKFLQKNTIFIRLMYYTVKGNLFFSQTTKIMEKILNRLNTSVPARTGLQHCLGLKK